MKKDRQTSKCFEATMPPHQSRCEDGRFQYCPAIWHHCSVSNTEKNEIIQERAQRYFINDYKSDCRSLLCQTSLPSLEEGRRKQIAIQTFKIVNNRLPPYLQDLITPRKCTRILRNSVKTLEILFTIELDTEQIHFHSCTKDLEQSTRGNSFRKAIATGLYTTID